MVLGQIISGGQPVPAAADDDHIIGRFRFWLTPSGGPAGLAGQTLFEKLPSRIAFHDLSNDRQQTKKHLNTLFMIMRDKTMNYLIFDRNCHHLTRADEYSIRWQSEWG